MCGLTWTKREPFAIHDTGPPTTSIYTTLMIIHGFSWQSSVFSRLLPFAEAHNTRIVLINRRGYPGSTPFGAKELQQMISFIMESPKSPTSLLNFMEERARELYDFIAAYIESEGITKEGGITIAGWSMGSLWINALLTFGPTFPIGNFPIADYIRALTAYDAPGLTLGYPPPLNAYNPLTHPSLSPDDRIKAFPRWVSSYYAHGESPTKLELRDAMSNPPPTITKMSQGELDLHLYTPPGSPDGCDAILVIFGVKYKIFERLRKAALFPDDKIQVSNEQTTKQADNTRNWQSIALRWVWCDHSIWEAPHAYWCLKEELQEAQGSGKQARQVDFIRLRGANHYLHWEEPERALLALLGKNDNGKFKL